MAHRKSARRRRVGGGARLAALGQAEGGAAVIARPQQVSPQSIAIPPPSPVCADDI